jgi:hypothetical protein
MAGETNVLAAQLINRHIGKVTLTAIKVVYRPGNGQTRQHQHQCQAQDDEGTF